MENTKSRLIEFTVMNTKKNIDLISVKEIAPKKIERAKANLENMKAAVNKLTEKAVKD